MNIFAKILKPLLLTSLIIVPFCALSQSYNTSSKKAINSFQKAKQDFLNENYVDALSNVNKALKFDENFLDAYLLMAEIYLDSNDDSLALESYEKLFEIDSLAFPKSAISLSKLYDKYLQFDKSIALLEWFLKLNNQNETIKNIAEEQLQLSYFRKSLVSKPVDYNPRNIENAVNTYADEYVNQYYVNEDKIIFTKKYKSNVNELYFDENVFVTKMYDSSWSLPQVLFNNINGIGAANVSADGNEIYFSGCGWENGMGSCDIYYVEFINGRWSEPINIKTINTSEWESQPCLSYDGKELYFVRRNKKTGTSDIYVSKRDDNDVWLKPNRLNDNVNTIGNEMAPFIHYDGMTLYFSSDKHFGMGGFDLFVSYRNEDNVWSEPINLGYPLNTCGDEINIVVLNDAEKAFMSAERSGGEGGYDIYEFELDEKYRPEYIELKKKSDNDYYADLRKHKSVVLKNIYFDFNSAELKTDSEAEIDKLYDFLMLNFDMIIVLEGHTDDVGDKEYNMILSEKRAESVKKALVDKGIADDRIKTKGYGDSQPLFPNNCDDELKYLNRRVSMSLANE